MTEEELMKFPKQALVKLITRSISYNDIHARKLLRFYSDDIAYQRVLKRREEIIKLMKKADHTLFMSLLHESIKLEKKAEKLRKAF